MKSILHVKNFGPIKDAKLDLRSVNVLIGPQASGKSTLAKLFTICKSPLMYFELEENKFSPRRKDGMVDFILNKPSYRKFVESLEFFSLSGYYNTSSEITFESSTHSIYIKNKKLVFRDNLNIGKLIELYKSKDIIKVREFISNLRKISDSFDFSFALELFWEKVGYDFDTENEKAVMDFLSFKDELKVNQPFEDKHLPYFIDLALELRSDVYNNNANYIPAERTIVSLIKQASLGFRRANIPLPGHLLDYAAKFEAATFSLKRLSLSFLRLDTEYKNVNGEDRIYFSERKSIRLTESASGFQSVVPMLLVLFNSKINADSQQSSFVIEEPETNLFPKAQYEVLKMIERSRENDFEMIDQGAMHIYTTHSPYVLSSLNNMLFAFKKGNKSDELTKKKIGRILSRENWIDPNDFSAYQISNGKAKSIFNRKSGLINETIIDVVSEDIINDFKKIAVISAEANVEK